MLFELVDKEILLTSHASFVQRVQVQTIDLDLTALSGVRPPLAALCTDLFLIVIAMRDSRDLGDPQALRKLVSHYLDQFSCNAAVSGVVAQDIESARYALVALLDETVLSLPGQCRDYWIGRPLQLDLFGTSVAGQEFYRRLEMILENPGAHDQLLEVYYLCLSLGFEGKYKMADTRERAGVVQSAGRALSEVRKLAQNGLSPHGIPKVSTARPNRLNAQWLSWWTIPLYGVSLTVLLWGALTVVNNVLVKGVVKTLLLPAGGVQ